VSTQAPHLPTGSPRGMWIALGAVLAGPLLGLYLGLAAGSGFAWWPSSEALARWLRHLDDPVAAAPPTVSIRPGIALFVAAAVTVTAWLLGTLALRARFRHHGVRQRGLATRSDARSMSTSAVRARAATLRPVHGADGIHDVGVFVGYREGHEPVWATIEDTFAVIGPARSGKTSRLIAPTIARWPGAAVVTGLRPDVLAWTTGRGARGHRWVFDPSATADSYSGADPLPWSPLTGCDVDITAAARAKALLAGLGPAQGQDVYWRGEGEKVLTCYLLAGATGRYTMNDVVAWSAVETSPVPIDALSAAGLHKWAKILEGLSTRNDRYRAGVWGQVTQALFPLNMATLARSCELRAGEGFDPADFVAAGNETMYILGDPDEQRAVGGLAIALITAITAAARRAARTSARLDPPLLVALDEAANTAPLHTIDQLLSSGGGSGICTIVAFQSLGQARETYGRDKGDAIIRDLATIKILFGGEGNADDLRELGDLLGERDEEVTSVSHQPGGSVLWSAASVQRHTRLRPVLATDELRTLGHEHAGEVLVIPRAAKAMRTRLPAVWERDPIGVM
jgi:type IV secretion system protein VirD4